MIEKKLNIEELKKQLEECQKKKDEYLAGWQRSRADLLNYKKEEMERIGEILKYAGEGLILKMLSILDNFDLAEKNLTTDLKKDENPEGKPSASYGASVKGILQIKAQIKDFLKTQGVEEIKTVGEKFDPNFHEVTEEVEAKDYNPPTTQQGEKQYIESGIVVEEERKGYKLHGKVLRPARVKVVK